MARFHVHFPIFAMADIYAMSADRMLGVAFSETESHERFSTISRYTRARLSSSCFFSRAKDLSSNAAPVDSRWFANRLSRQAFRQLPGRSWSESDLAGSDRRRSAHILAHESAMSSTISETVFKVGRNDSTLLNSSSNAVHSDFTTSSSKSGFQIF